MSRRQPHVAEKTVELDGLLVPPRQRLQVRRLEGLRAVLHPLAAVLVVALRHDSLGQKVVAALAEHVVGERPVQLDGRDVQVERVHRLALQDVDPRLLW